jgi:antitoxin component of RelBE/YafQ-DinJ toxin-antitoxin module
VRQSSTISAVVPAAVKAEAKAILAAHGVSMAWLLREFLTRMAAHDAETLAWLKEASR